MKKRTSLNSKVVLIGIAIIVVFICYLLFIALRIQQTTVIECKNTMKNLTETALATLQYYDAAQKRGEMSLAEAQQHAREMLKHARYGADDYFWILDAKPNMVMHPYKPELDGTDVGSHTDVQGTPVFQRMAEICASHGEGFVQYWWPKPGGSQPLKKLSYVTTYKPWNWIVGTGTYFDDLFRNITAIRFTLIGLIICLSIGLSVLFYWFVRSVSLPIKNTSEGLSLVGAQLTQAADQVSSSSQLLAQASSEQAASLEETSSSLEEMASMTKNNADNAIQADNLMREANQVVEHARSSMQALESAMQEISNSSRDISRIIKTIDEIAFQTNLLALNAAVEAARAGEAGAGFAVVADEVRSLAMRVAEAAKSTGGLIENTVRKVQDGSDVMQQANEAFGNVSRKAAHVAQLVSEIAAASREQAEGIEQINHVVSQMDKVIQQNAANAEESASAAEELKSQAVYLKRYIGVLDGLVRGGEHHDDMTSAGGTHTAALQVPGTRLATRRKEPAGAAEDILDDASLKNF